MVPSCYKYCFPPMTPQNETSPMTHRWPIPTNWCSVNLSIFSKKKKVKRYLLQAILKLILKDLGKFGTLKYVTHVWCTNTNAMTLIGQTWNLVKGLLCWYHKNHVTYKSKIIHIMCLLSYRVGWTNWLTKRQVVSRSKCWCGWLILT